MFASIGSWLLGLVLSKSTTGFLQKVIDRLATSEDGAAKLEEIRSRSAVALSTEDTARMKIHADATGNRQSAKMNQPVFWVLICIMIVPAAWHLWGVALYGVFWHSNGIWPQPWDIAAYPPSVAPWVQQSINWLYDPIGVPSTVGAAAVASWLTGRR